VDAKPRTIVIYQSKDGHVPFTEWIDALGDDETSAIVVARLERVEAGLFGDCRSVGGGVTEFRIDIGPGYRVYFGQLGDVVVLLNGGDKSAQDADVAKAQQLWREFKSREDK